MRNVLGLIFGGLALATACVVDVRPADAAQQHMCQPSRAGVASGPGQWRAPTSGTRYNLDGLGCAVLAYTDVGDAVAAGFVNRAGGFTLSKATITTSDSSLSVPPGAYIKAMTVRESSGASLSGNLIIGTAAGGNQICCVGAMNIPSGLVETLSDAQIKKKAFSATTTQSLFITTTGGFGSGALDITIELGYF